MKRNPALVRREFGGVDLHRRVAHVLVLLSGGEVQKEEATRSTTAYTVVPQLLAIAGPLLGAAAVFAYLLRYSAVRADDVYQGFVAFKGRVRYLGAVSGNHRQGEAGIGHDWTD